MTYLLRQIIMTMLWSVKLTCWVFCPEQKPSWFMTLNMGARWFNVVLSVNLLYHWDVWCFCTFREINYIMLHWHIFVKKWSLTLYFGQICCIWIQHSLGNMKIATLMWPWCDLDDQTVLLVYRPLSKLTYWQPVQHGILKKLVCQAIFCVHLSIMHMQISTILR